MFARPPTMLVGPQYPNAKRSNACVTLQTTDVSPSVPFALLHTLAGRMRAADVRLRTPCAPLQTTIVAVQTGITGQQTAIGNGLFTGQSVR